MTTEYVGDVQSSPLSTAQLPHLEHSGKVAKAPPQFSDEKKSFVVEGLSFYTLCTAGFTMKDCNTLLLC